MPIKMYFERGDTDIRELVLAKPPHKPADRFFSNSFEWSADRVARKCPSPVEAVKSKILSETACRRHAMLSQEKLMRTVEVADMRGVQVGHPANRDLLGD